MAKQIPLPFSAIRNADFLSNHWLEKRLTDQPEWINLRSAANEALTQIAALWEQQKKLAPKYDDEAGLEQAFIQPVFDLLGWKIKYQARLQNRKPDYASPSNAFTLLYRHPLHLFRRRRPPSRPSRNASKSEQSLLASES